MLYFSLYINNKKTLFPRIQLTVKSPHFPVIRFLTHLASVNAIKLVLYVN